MPVITWAPTLQTGARREATEDRPVADFGVPRQRGIVGKDGAVPHHAIVRDVDVGLIQLWLPIVVTPRSCTVPVLKGQNSRITLWSPISSRVGRRRISCPAALRRAKRNGNPVVRTDSGMAGDHAWAPTLVPAPISSVTMIV